MKLLTLPLNEKNSCVAGDICRKFATLYAIFGGDGLPRAIKMRLKFFTKRWVW